MDPNVETSSVDSNSRDFDREIRESGHTSGKENRDRYSGVCYDRALSTQVAWLQSYLRAD